MLEIDFLAVESPGGSGSKSGDAIALRFTSATAVDPIVVVIDGGYGDVGQRLVGHIRHFYETDKVDLVISTHPDADHLNGLLPVVEELDVVELMLHLPWNHHDDVSEYSNIEKIEALYAAAIAKGATVTEPFAGEQRFNGAVRILGPSQGYYEELLKEELPSNVVEKALKATAGFARSLTETDELSDAALDDTDDTSPRNNTSSIVSVFASDEFHVFTGDAGIHALTLAADEFDARLGPGRPSQVEFIQVPHHGSRHNLGPAVLDRWFPNGSADSTAFISSALADEKHPAVAVLAELKERGFRVHSTESRNLLHSHDGAERPTYREAHSA